ncbi:hypothetical protein SSAG_05035 [Streptomyces sp. Mg1]|nr:hypothetical protein SSAG_05035 [Streptomyces sp. Mg1]
MPIARSDIHELVTSYLERHPGRTGSAGAPVGYFFFFFFLRHGTPAAPSGARLRGRDGRDRIEHVDSWIYIYSTMW